MIWRRREENNLRARVVLPSPTKVARRLGARYSALESHAVAYGRSTKFLPFCVWLLLTCFEVRHVGPRLQNYSGTLVAQPVLTADSHLANVTMLPEMNV